MGDIENLTTTVNPMTAGHAGSASSNSNAALRLDVVELTYGVVNQERKIKRLLKNVTLSLESGNMCALMGPSGAGKR